jgi:RHS repeat-associated protein
MRSKQINIIKDKSIALESGVFSGLNKVLGNTSLTCPIITMGVSNTFRYNYLPGRTSLMNSSLRNHLLPRYCLARHNTILRTDNALAKWHAGFCVVSNWYDGGFGDGYRFGFNGQEKDNEIKGVGNGLDFGARVYDSRLGRWLSLDPLQAKYPSLSAYNFCADNPILFIDPDGKRIMITDFSTGKPLLYVPNMKLTGDKTTDMMITSMNMVYNASLSNKKDKSTVDYLIKTNQEISIVYNVDGTYSRFEGGEQGGTLVFKADVAKQHESGAISVSGAVLGHELEHAFRQAKIQDAMNEARKKGDKAKAVELMKELIEIQAAPEGALYGDAKDKQEAAKEEQRATDGLENTVNTVYKHKGRKSYSDKAIKCFPVDSPNSESEARKPDQKTKEQCDEYNKPQ